MLARILDCAIPTGVAVDVVVVDNNSTDDTPAVIAEFVRRSPLPITVVTERRQGSGAARNAAFRAARGDVICTTDDDIYLAPDFFLCVCREFQRQDGPAIVGGRVELWDAQDQPYTIKTDCEEQRLTAFMDPAGFIIGGNMSFTRTILDRIGGYDARFGAGAPLKAAEETDFVFRAFRAGIEVRYAPSIVAYHHHRRTKDAEIAALEHGYNIGAGAFRFKHMLALDPVIWRIVYWDLRAVARTMLAPPPGGRRGVTRCAESEATRSARRGSCSRKVARDGPCRPGHQPLHREAWRPRGRAYRETARRSRSISLHSFCRPGSVVVTR
jgi:GT2 family glycosyltransferase